jgi:hypothetical protein
MQYKQLRAPSGGMAPALWPAMRLLYSLVLATALGACAAPTAPDNPADQLEQARARWQQAGIASYRYTITRTCECTPEMTGPVTVEVRSGQVASQRYETGSAVDPQYADLFAPVPGLFDLIERAILLPAASVSVRYHQTLGYPESIAIDEVAGVVDDEVSYRVTGFAEVAN